MTDFLPGTSDPVPAVMTGEELARYLRVKANNTEAAICNLRSKHSMPRTMIGQQMVYPRKSIDKWLAHRAENHAGVEWAEELPTGERHG